MLQKKKNQKVPPHRKYRLRIKSTTNKYLDWILVVAAVAVIILLCSTALRYVEGETKSLPTEITILRTQVANACGQKGVAAHFAEWVRGQSTEALKFDIIDISNFDNSAIPQTMVFIRDQSLASKAAMISERLGIKPENIVPNRLEDNFLALDITIVVGKDYEKFEKSAAVMRTEILNGCGLKGIAQKFSLWLDRLSDSELSFEVASEENYGNFNVKETMLILNSTKAQAYSAQLADKLEIKPANVILDNSGKKTATADITIVIGNDWGQKLSVE